MIDYRDEVFCLETNRCGYYIAQRGELAETLHFGTKIHPSREALAERQAVSYGSDVAYQAQTGPDSLGHLCLELTPDCKGDMRQNSLEITLGNGSRVVEFRLDRHAIYEGNCPPTGMPSAYGAQSPGTGL